MGHIFLHVLITMIGGAVIAAAAAWLSWIALSWSRYAGFGPLAAFGILLALLHGSDFAQMILVFSGLFALGGLAALTFPDASEQDVRSTPTAFIRKRPL